MGLLPGPFWAYRDHGFEQPALYLPGNGLAGVLNQDIYIWPLPVYLQDYGLAGITEINGVGYEFIQHLYQ